MLDLFSLVFFMADILFLFIIEKAQGLLITLTVALLISKVQRSETQKPGPETEAAKCVELLFMLLFKSVVYPT